MAIYKNKKTRIGASILNSDFLHLEDEIRKVEKLEVDYLHLDIMDGLFVPNMSIGPGVIKSIRSATDMFLDVHLMMTQPDRLLDSFIDAGADSISVHVEECKHLDGTLKHIKEAGLKAAVALNPATPVNTIENVLDILDMVLIMTVNPGFGGQSFIGNMTEKIKDLRSMIEARGRKTGKVYGINIEVDGGINEKTADSVIGSGADMLVLGSALFMSGDPAKVVNSVLKNKGLTI